MSFKFIFDEVIEIEFNYIIFYYPIIMSDSYRGANQAVGIL